MIRIPSHVDIAGNEAVKRVAKKISSSDLEAQNIWFLTDLKIHFKNAIHHKRKSSGFEHLPNFVQYTYYRLLRNS